MAVVVFDPAAFVARFKVFAAFNTANAGALQGYFDTATLYLSNKDSSRVADPVRRAGLLWLLVAHLAQLDGVLQAAGVGSQADKVGRMSSASEGSVSATFDNGSQPGSSAWYQQTQYGSTYWNATANLRTMRYVRPVG